MKKILPADTSNFTLKRHHKHFEKPIKYSLQLLMNYSFQILILRFNTYWPLGSPSEFILTSVIAVAF